MYAYAMTFFIWIFVTLAAQAAESVTFSAKTAAPLSAPPGQLNLAGLIQLAEHGQVDLVAARVSTEQARLETVSGRSALLPDLKLESSLGRDYQTSARDQESTSSAAALRSRWSVYDNGVSWTNYHIDRLQADLARTKELKTRDEIVLNILNRYSSAWIARRRKEITIQRLKLLQAQHLITERQFRQGLKARGDYQRLQSELQRAKLSLERQGNEELGRLEELGRFLGFSTAINWSQLTAFPAIELLKRFSTATIPPPDSALSVVLASKDVEIKVSQARLTHRQLWPELSVSLSAAYGSNDFVRSDQTWSDQERWSADGRLELDWTLWDWQDRRSQHQKTELENQLSRRRLEQANLDHQTTLSRLQREKRRLNESIQLVQEIYQIELKTFRDIEGEYREGKASYLDLISSLDRRTQAELDFEEESSLAVLNAAEILHLFGELYAQSIRP